MSPTIGSGKNCHVEMLATDMARSAAFYRAVFGRTIGPERTERLPSTTASGR